MGKKSKKIFKNVLFGLIAGLFAYIVLLFINNPWEEVIPALLFGSVPGFVDRKRNTIFIGAFSASMGWLAGTFIFGIWLEIGLGAWVISGATLGLTSGFFGGSFPRALFGFLLGALAGLLAETSRYLTVFFEGLRLMDMQLILLVMAGILLPFAAALVTKPQKKE
jgi:hypothetical protein